MRRDLVGWTRSLLLLGALVAGAGIPGAAAGQGSGDPGEPALRFTAGDAAWAGGFAVGAVLVGRHDRSIASVLRDPALLGNEWISVPADGARILGFPGALLITGGLYGVGRLTDRPDLAGMGLHASGAIVLATAVTVGTKVLVGRARPRASPDDAYDFGLGRGWEERYRSFPSSHAAMAFAAAAAVTSEVRHYWPHAETVVGAALFGVAGLAGASRIYHDAHWASDVVIGAGIGTFAGWKVVQYAHARPDNPLDRWLLGVTIAPEADGHSVRFWMAPGR